MRFHPRELCVFGPYFCTSLIWPRPRGEEGNCSYPFPLSHRVKQTNNIKNIKDITCSVIGGNHRNPVDSHYKWSVIRKVFLRHHQHSNLSSLSAHEIVVIATPGAAVFGRFLFAENVFEIIIFKVASSHFKICTRQFQMHFPEWKPLFWFKFHLSLLLRALISISSDNGLASNRQETITRTNDDPVPWYVSQAQRARSAIITSLCRQNDVATSF